MVLSFVISTIVDTTNRRIPERGANASQAVEPTAGSPMTSTPFGEYS